MTALAILSVRTVPAQEALRNSLAGNAAAEARSRQTESLPYTVKMGDFRLLLTPSLGLDWNDNINISGGSSQEDFILRPLLRLNASYPITRHNLLRLNLGVGYDHYFNHDQYSGFRLQSGSEISFDTYVKDFWFNFHDRFEYTQDSAGHSAVANSGRYGGFDNTVGLTATWDLQDLVLTAGYDHNNFISSSSEFSYTDRSTEMFVSRAGFRIHPRLTVGIEGTAALTSYDEKLLNDNTSYSGGIYADWRPGNYFSIQPRVGYTYYDFDQTSPFIRAVDQDGWYADITLSHHITEAMTYSLTAGRELRLGIQADSMEDWYVRPNLNWRALDDLNLNVFLSYETGSQGSSRQIGALAEEYDWFGAGLGLSYPLMKKLTASLNYRLTIRSSDALSRDYTQNVVGLLFTYHLQ